MRGRDGCGGWEGEHGQKNYTNAPGARAHAIGSCCRRVPDSCDDAKMAPITQPVTPADTLYFGLRLYELLTLVGIVLGPIFAVAITLITESYRTQREAKRTILHTLLTTRGRYADPGFSWAIRAAHLEFARSPKVRAVLEAYLNQVRIRPTSGAEEPHHRESSRREGVLISEMLKDLGYAGLTSEQIESYTAQGLVDRELIFQYALEAMPHLAISAKRSADAAEEMLKRLPSQLLS